MPLNTHLTQFFEIEHPILLAPTTEVSGGPARRDRDSDWRPRCHRRRLGRRGLAAAPIRRNAAGNGRSKIHQVEPRP